jgi:hypothetical protein
MAAGGAGGKLGWASCGCGWWASSVGLGRRMAWPAGRCLPDARPMSPNAGHEVGSFAQAPGSGVVSASLRVLANDAAVVTFRLRKEPASAPPPSGDRALGGVQLVLWAGSFRATRVLQAVVSASAGLGWRVTTRRLMLSIDL